MRGQKSKTQETGARAAKARSGAGKVKKGGKGPDQSWDIGERAKTRGASDSSGWSNVYGGETKVETPPGRRGFPVFESLGQAAAVLGAPLALLKAAKRKGCKAFISGSRVDAELLIPFLFGMLTEESELPAGIASAADWLMTEKAKREAIKRKADEKKMMPTADAVRQAAQACDYFFAELERGERELPPALAGGTATDIFKRLHSFTEGLRKAGKEKFEAIGKPA